MPKVTFITPDGEKITVDDAEGTLMEVASDYQVPGIDAICGGVCSCATCHVRVKDEWLEKVGPQNETEKDILDLEDGADANSRLSCQIEITDELDGLVVEVVEL
jgi:2Fe-2S ferredoxin